MGLPNSPLCRRYGAEKETLAHTPCECEALASLRHIQDVPGGKVNTLGGHSIGHSEQKTLYEHVSHSERFAR